MNEIVNRFRALTEREQKLVIASLVVVVIAVFYFAIWRPMNQSIVQKNRAIESQTELLNWITQRSAQARQLRTMTGGQKSFNGSLPQAVNSTTSRYNIAISRMQPQGEELQVWVDEAEFNQVLAWLQSMEKMGILIKQVDIAESDKSGLIRLRRLQLGKS